MKEDKLFKNRREGFYDVRYIKSDWQFEHLQDREYKYFYGKSITGRRGYYLLKPERNEGLQHFFLVMDIARYLSKHFKVWIFKTTLPDVIFQFRNKKIGIEVEIGKVLKDKVKFLNKVKICNDHFGEDWFFVVTNRNLLKKYRKFGKTYTRKTVLKKLRWYVRNKPEKLQIIIPKKKVHHSYYYPF
ncbi:hypothetical protein J4217_04365 [Candidatus Pacearchaeota archaeon]|nr:hypothetical protein [Candidatus Pacearchaeota archaeon]